MAEFDNKTVYILDSYGLIFRCYFAFINRPLTNSRGENISALFGFFRNFHYILEHYKPGYIFAAMDSKTKTFRHEMYEQYKATRNKTPEDLHAQIPWIEDVLQALGIPVLQCDGYEADDVIATVARKCREAGRTCRILSGDKDLMQLVDDSTQILKPENGGGWKVTGPDGVFAEWGVQPEQLLDLLSLYGDTADNIPGVAGVGVKTAGKLLTDYKNLDGIYAHIDEIKGAMQKKLIDGKENAYFSQKLVRLCDEVPCDEIDTAIFADEYSFNYKAAADKLMEYGAFAVAKQYGELGVGGGAVNGSTVVNGGTAAVNTGASGGDSAQSGKVAAEDGDATLELRPLQKNEGSYKAFTNLSDLKTFIDDFLAKGEENHLSIAYDSETTGLDTTTAKIIGFSLSYKAGTGVYVPLQQEATDLFSETNYIEKDDAFSQLKRLFANPDVSVIMHNGKYDLEILANNGYLLEKGKQLDFDDAFKCRFIDTMVAAWLLSPDAVGKSSFGLEYLAETKLCLVGIEFDEIVEKGQTFADVPLETATSYAAEDADFTWQLWQVLEKDLCQNPKNARLCELFNTLEMPLIPVLTKMELAGIHLDTATLHAFNKELTEGIAQAEKDIYKEVGHEFNIASPKQLQTVLFEERGLTPGKKTKTGYSTDTSVLEELAAVDAVPRMILEYREMAKLQSTYVETLPTMCDSHGRIHTNFIQTGTATGRLSCRDPNLQNIPVRSDAGRRIRGAFTAPEGKVLISADYSQIELVVLAHLSGDKNMCNAFTSGIDVHKATAAMIFGVSPEAVTPEMRRTAKTINFGVIYGMSAFSLAKDLGISRTQAQTFIDMYFATYSSVSNFMQSVITGAEDTGSVETMFGRRRKIMNINSRNKLEKSGAERMAKNTPIQGTAADIVKKAMLGVSAALKEKNSPARLLLQVHDELIFECPEDSAVVEETIALIRDKMENAVKLSIPLKVSVEYGKNWGEFH